MHGSNRRRATSLLGNEQGVGISLQITQVFKNANLNRTSLN
jgi:hypothetical protein